MLRRALGAGVRPPLRPVARVAAGLAAPRVCRPGTGLSALDQRLVNVAPLATVASRWPSLLLQERAVKLEPTAPLDHPWRGGLAGRGFGKAVRVSIDVKQVRNQDPQQMLNMFRRKCRQNIYYMSNMYFDDATGATS